MDSACGVGLWSLEMAQEYPGSKVTGIDVVPPSEKEGWNPTNLIAGQIKSVKYQYGDIHQPLLFPDNHFDLVYQRDVATVLPFNMWPTLISEFKRVLKPDGQIQLVEYGKILGKQHFLEFCLTLTINNVTNQIYYLETQDLFYPK